MSTLIPNLTFLVIRMRSEPRGPMNRFVAIAWNYDYGQMMSTKPCHSYTDARKELDDLVAERRCALRWFDGEYQVIGDGAHIEPVECPTVSRDTEDDLAHQA